MPSVVDICNSALDKIGGGAITSLADGDKKANLCNRNWPLVRDRVLRMKPWNFAVVRTNLAASTTAPDWGFAYKHPLPSGCLRLLEVLDLRADEYQVEGRFVFTDSTPVYIRYINRVTDPNEYDTLFQDLVACALAAEIAYPLTQSATVKDVARKEYQDALVMAGFVDAQENPVSLFEEDDWVAARY